MILAAEVKQNRSSQTSLFLTPSSTIRPSLLKHKHLISFNNHYKFASLVIELSITVCILTFSTTPAPHLVSSHLSKL